MRYAAGRGGEKRERERKEREREREREREIDSQPDKLTVSGYTYMLLT